MLCNTLCLCCPCNLRPGYVYRTLRLIYSYLWGYCGTCGRSGARTNRHNRCGGYSTILMFSGIIDARIGISMRFMGFASMWLIV